MDKKIQNLPFWSYDEQEIFKRLKSSDKGLSEEEVQLRQKVFGTNLLPEKKNGPLKILFRQFGNPLIFILLFASFVTLLLREFGDSTIILLAVAVNTGLGFYQENKAESALRHLKSYLEQRTRVIRDRRESEISVDELVPGDLIKITSGTRIPADARILSSTDLSLDESMLTGESLPIEKNKEILPTTTSLVNRTNYLHAGSLVTQGNGLAIITATGPQTELGKIATLMTKGKDFGTPLQKSINRFAWFAAIVISVIVIFIFIAGLWRGEPILDMFLASVAVAVGAIPEGLPIALTVILSVGVERLARKKAVVRKLVAAETLGSTTLILTDKTGTLTEAKMSLAHLASLKNLLTNSVPKERLSTDPLEKTEQNMALLALINCDITLAGNKKKETNPSFSGKPLEVSLASEIQKRGFDIFSFKDKISPITISPFNSKNKYSAYLINKPVPELNFLPWKDFTAFLTYFGAPEILIENSFLAEEEQKLIKQKVEELAEQGERVLAIGYKPLKEDQLGHDSLKQGPDNLNFVGLISFYDPPRPDVKKTLHQIKKLGVKIVIATGDHPGTAVALAKEVGLEIDKSQVVEGNDLRSLSDDDLVSFIESVKVFARVTPEDKLRITNAYQKRGEVIAMTGDGINDAPALKNADIGISLGSGTDVAKDTADMVLLDDNLSTIVKAIEEGRKIIANAKKTLIYFLSGILDEILLIGGSILFGLPLPITAVQILWVNFFSDSLPAVAFAFENQPADSRQKHQNILFDREVKVLVATIGLLTSLALFGLYLILLNLGYPLSLIKTFIFASFGLYSLFLVFPLKNLAQPIFRLNLLSNRYMMIGVILGLIMMGSAIYLPVANKLLDTVPLPLDWLIWVGLICLVNLLIAELSKSLVKLLKDKKSQTKFFFQ